MHRSRKEGPVDDAMLTQPPERPRRPRNGASFSPTFAAAGLIVAVAILVSTVTRAGLPGSSPDASLVSEPAPTEAATPQASLPSDPPPASPSPDVAPSSTPEAPSAFAEAFASVSWATIDPRTSDWLIGHGQGQSSTLKLGRGWALEDWSSVAFTSNASGGVAAGYVDRSGEVRQWAVPFDIIRTALARINRTGTTLYVHDSERDVDGGVITIDTSDGTVTELIPRRDVAENFSRNRFTWSPSGDRLMSTLCDLERCFVDIIDDQTKTVRRLPEAFPALALTDRFVVGRWDIGSPWVAWDLASDAMREMPLDPSWNTGYMLTLDGDRMLVGHLGDGGYTVFLVSIPSGDSTVVYREAGPDAAGLRLTNVRPAAGRWAILTTSESFYPDVSAAGDLVFPEVVGLDLTSGALEPPLVIAGG
jgi:hypothetical protein